MLEIKAGHTVQGPRWPEPAEVNLVEELQQQASSLPLQADEWRLYAKS